MNDAINTDIAIVGAGLVGLMAAHELSSLGGKTVALIAPPHNGNDGRTTAMLMPTIERLEAYGVWPMAKSKTAPLRTMRLIDGTKRLLRARPISFEAGELGVDAFGYNIPNADMTQLLEDRLPHNVSRISSSVLSAHAEEGKTCLVLENGTSVQAELAIAADGRNSILRETAGIGIRHWSYPQVALVTSFAHTLPHNDVSTEFHTESGPFTQVPLPPIQGKKYLSSLVWAVRPKQAETILAQSTESLAATIEGKMQSILGKVTIESDLQSFPLSGQTATKFAANGIALIGEAAHVFPPIGAQGFNLGVRDVVALKAALASLSSNPLEQYSRARLLDVNTRSMGVHMLNRSLLSDFLPVQAARVAGVAALQSWGWLRKRIMQQGMGVITETGPAATDRT